MTDRCVDASVMVKLALKGEAHRTTARRLVRESVAAGIILIAPPLFIASYAALAALRGCEFWTADKVFYEAVQAALSFVKYLPEYP